jgi:hypothetical protein
MTHDFRPAVRENIGLIIGLSGPTGGGKTLSALRLARGLAGGNDAKIFAIDTEARRALYYACSPGEEPGEDRFAFHHCPLGPPFRPDTYRDVVFSADKAGASVIIVDSMSHEHAGEGGLLDWHEEELHRLAGNDAFKREQLKMTAWIKPKMSHKRMMSSFLQCRAHLIFCLRAEEKMLVTTEVDSRTGKKKAKFVAAADQPITERWHPTCEKTFMYEMTLSFLLLADKPGIPRPVKLQQQHRAFVPLDQPVSEETGQRLAAWAKGGADAEAVNKAPEAPSSPAKAAPPPPADYGIEALREKGHSAAALGVDNLQRWWKGGLSKTQRVALGNPFLDELKLAAQKADEAADAIDQGAASTETAS